MACKAFSPLEPISSLDHTDSKLSLRLLSQLAHFTSSCKQASKPQRRPVTACNAREFSVKPSPTSLKPEDGPNVLPAAFLEKEAAQQQEMLNGFPATEKAIVKPPPTAAISPFPEGFLDSTTIKRLDWVTIVPNHMLPRGERLVLRHNREDVMLFWFKDKIFALENRSPAASTFKKGISEAEITEEGLVICPYTQSTFDIKTGATIEWLPNNPLLRLLTPALSDLTIYAVKVSPDHIYINTRPLLVGGYFFGAEFSGNRISTDPNYEKPIIFDDLEVDFGFTPENEIINGRAAMVGFFTLLMFEKMSGEGFLKGFGILDFLYQYLPGFPVLKY